MKSKLLKGSLIFFAGSMVVNVIAFAYHFILARLLSPADYGILAALFGLIYLTSIPLNAADILVTKLISGFEEGKMISNTKALLFLLARKVGPLYGILFPILILLSWPVQSFLKLPNIWAVISIWIFVYLFIITAILRPVMKALLRFNDLILSQMAESVLRLLFSVGLVLVFGSWYGWGIFGILFAAIICLFFAIFQVRDVLWSKPVKFDYHRLNIKSLGLGSLVLSISYTLMYSVDVLLVKHFFSDYWTGIYAVLVTAGKVIFFAQTPISTATLPIVARKAKSPQTARADLWTLLGLSTLISLVTITGYFFGSELLVKIVFSDKYLAAVPMIPWMGIAIFGFSLASIGANFLLALNKIKAAWISLLGLVAEASAIFLFHQTIMQVVLSLGVVFGILAAVLITYSFYVTRKTFNNSTSI